MFIKRRLRAAVAGLAAVAVVAGGLGSAGGAAAAPAAKAASNAPVHNCTFKTYNKGRYLTAVGGGGRTTDVLHTDAVRARSWEKFTLVDSGDGSSTIRYGIQTKTGNFLTAVGGGGRITDVMHSDATQLRDWEKLTLIARRRRLRDPDDRRPLPDRRRRRRPHHRHDPLRCDAHRLVGEVPGRLQPVGSPADGSRAPARDPCVVRRCSRRRWA
jgi:hypothetical protein